MIVSLGKLVIQYRSTEGRKEKLAYHQMGAEEPPIKLSLSAFPNIKGRNK